MTIVGAGVGASFTPAPFSGPFDPVSLGDCELYLRSDDPGIEVVSGNVATWPDRSGNGNDASQATPANRPAYGTIGGQAGKPFVDFDSVQQESLNGTISDGASSYTLFAVVEKTLDTAAQCLLGTASANFPVLGGWGALDVALRKMFIFDSLTRHIGEVPNGVQYLSWIHDHTVPQVRGYRNGSLVGTVATDGARTIGTNYAIGKLQYTGAFFLQGKVSLVLFYKRKLDPGEVARVDQWIEQEWELS